MLDLWPLKVETSIGSRQIGPLTVGPSNLSPMKMWGPICRDPIVTFSCSRANWALERSENFHPQLLWDLRSDILWEALQKLQWWNHFVLRGVHNTPRAIAVQTFPQKVAVSLLKSFIKIFLLNSQNLGQMRQSNLPSLQPQKIGSLLSCFDQFK